MAGKGPSDGGKSGTVRSDDPEVICNRVGCGAYRVKGTTVCRRHGADTTVAARRVAEAEVVAIARKELGVTTVMPKDIINVVGELVAWHLGVARDLQRELDEVRIIGGPIEMARQYEDIMNRLDRSAASISKLMGGVAALGIADALKAHVEKQTEAQLEDRRQRLLTLTLDASTVAGDWWRCGECGRACCQQVVEG